MTKVLIKRFKIIEFKENILKADSNIIEYKEALFKKIKLKIKKDMYLV